MSLSPEDGVRRTLALYAHRVDNRDAAGWSQLFASDGRFVTPPDEYVGRQALQKFLDELIASWLPLGRRTKHFQTNALIRVDGDAAIARSNVIVYEGFGDGPWQIAGLNNYADRLIRAGDDWLFAERQFSRS